MRTSPHHPAEIARVTQAGSRGVTIELALHLAASPGQFAMVWLPRVDEKPFSLVDADPVTLTIVRVGPFTERMHQLRAGDRLYLRGPLGNGFSLAGQRPLLIAGGCGSAPLAFLAKRLREAGRRVTVALGAATAAELLLVDRFWALGARVLVSTEDGSSGHRGLVTEVARERLLSQKHDQVYACGPTPMLAPVQDLCRRHGIPGQVSWEAYMRCGLGVCGSCDRGDGLLVCRDGPVFPVH